MSGYIKSINISIRKGIKKTSVSEALLVENHGIKGDVHAGKWHRQVSLLDDTSFQKMPIDLNPGDFAENITTIGIDVMNLPIGTRLHINKAVLEITQIGKECHNACAIKSQVGDCVMPREGVFAKVIKGGKIKLNDEIIVGDVNV